MTTNKILISPPFGHYLKNIAKTTPIRGTFTVKAKKGIYKNVLKTIRFTPSGWVNKMGLANWGMFSFADWDEDHIWSITVPEKYDDWLIFLHELPADLQLELNFGCPNANFIKPNDMVMQEFVNKFKSIIVKVPGVYIDSKKLIKECYNNGVTQFHIANTIPTNRGGLSGKKIQSVSLPLIESIKIKHPNITIIGGGGIYSKYDIKKYRNAGADKFSLATVFITHPWNLPGIFNEVYSKN